MKRTLIIFSVLIFLGMVMAGSSQRAFTAETDKTCCQKFQLISAGSVLTGCVISIVYAGTPLQCKPDKTGKCEICNIPAGVEYTVEAVCDGDRRGSTTFTACTDGYVTIYVP
jgi:hypothetical protein